MHRRAIDLQHERPDEARRLLATALRQSPRLWVAQAWYGRILLRANDRDSYRKWRNDLPAEADESPEIWLVRAEEATTEENLPGAVRCYAEAVAHDPNYLAAVTGLARSLQTLEKENEATPFRERAGVWNNWRRRRARTQISGSRPASNRPLARPNSGWPGRRGAGTTCSTNTNVSTTGRAKPPQRNLSRRNASHRRHSTRRPHRRVVRTSGLPAANGLTARRSDRRFPAGNRPAFARISLHRRGRRQRSRPGLSQRT